MSEVIDLVFEFDDGTDPDKATRAVLDALRSLPEATEVDAEPARPMTVDANQVILTVLAVVGVLKVTVWQLDELTTDLTKLVRNLRGLRRVVLRAEDNVRESSRATRQSRRCLAAVRPSRDYCRRRRSHADRCAHTLADLTEMVNREANLQRQQR